MKFIYLLTMVCFVLILNSCAAPQPISKPVKEPRHIAFYSKRTPNVPYILLGEGKISKFNAAGYKKQEATMREDLQKVAASKGGDALIDLKHDAKMFSGKIIAFQKDVNHISLG